ncbi:tetratricopeptide repeat protein [Aporhodopirellula aestuarii]|uniref:Protein-disulfide isomerase n=1 Tax=Aporhodopirellula aestuarii TaxID=2950107 RepID=A0ABT0UEB5_9BACT|nr:protein-disulfide isomerase [Aporhodopirellula aestuarii]MCM2374800.1 protein-disulfide isomerase [Aporhodopirellula aestuarii]
MSIDTYAICPCGSGKKIKFCKCKDSVHELDRVLTMVEGGQLVPALDRLAAILDQHPDAAWALAIRGRLLMDLREYDSLKENAERFTRLQPSNPLALTQSAAAAMFAQDLGKATELMLEALTESGQNVDSFVLDVASLLAYGLAGNGILLTARIYATLAFVSEGYEGSNMAANVLQQINRDPAVNHLAKFMPELIPRPEGVDWAERYDEAALMLANNKIVLAENKFESLQRTAPLQPAVLSGLLTCAVWRGDYKKQIELLNKLSQCEDLSADDRARYLATSFVVGPESDAISVEKRTLMADVDSIEETMMSLSAHPRFAELPPDFLQQLKGDNEIGPRAAYQLLDRDPPSEEGVPSDLNSVPESIALVTVFGRETDRPARVEVIGITAQHEQTARELLGLALPGRHFESDREGWLPINYIAMIQPGGLKITDPSQFESLQQNLFVERAATKLAETPVPLLGNASLKDTAGDDSMWLARAALLRYLEGEDGLVARDGTLIARLYEIGGRPTPESIAATGDEVENIPAYDLNRVDPAGLDVENLVYLIQRAQQISATTIGRRASRQLLETELPTEGELAGAKLLAYSFLMQSAASSDEAIENLEAAKAYAESHSFSTASLLLAELPLRLRRGEPEKFQDCVQTIARNHGKDPEVMGRLQQLLVQFGLIRPDGSPVQSRPAAPAASDGGGLWTPDGGGGGAPAPAGESGGAAPSKLWVPGMD